MEWLKKCNLTYFGFTRVVFGVNASPFILNATIRHHVNTCMLNENAFALELLKSLYVDDFVSGAKDVNIAFSLSKEIKLCLKSGGFTFTCSSRMFIF